MTAFLTREDPDLTFPTLAICSDDGIRRKRMEQELGLGSNYWLLRGGNSSMPWPKDHIQLDEWYNMSTFSKEDVTESIK